MPSRALQLLDLEAHLDAQLGVEVGQRLVEQEHAGLADDRPAHRHPLALAAGELPGAALELLVGELEDRRRLAHPLVDLGLGHAPDLQPVGHVLVDRHVRIEGVVLEHHGDVALGRLQLVDHPAGDGDLAAGDRLQPGDHPEQGRLAAAAGADDHQQLAVGDVAVDAVDHLGAAKGLVDAAQVDFGHRCCPISRSRPGP